MSWDSIRANWFQWRGRMRMQWGRLSDDSLGVIEGRRELLLGQLQEMYGVTAEEAEHQVAEWERRGGLPPGVMPSGGVR